MQNTPLIDAHCHLDFENFDRDRAAVLQRARDANISDIIIPATEKIYWDRIQSLCEQNPHLHACYGLHPYWVHRHSKTDIQALENYLVNNQAVALGECGLDFRPQQADKKEQLDYFEAQLNIADSLDLPVVIHAVKATQTVIQTLRKYSRLRGMIHSYSGSSEQARQLVELNFFISLGAAVTWQQAKKIRKVASEIPLTSMLLETDAPDQPDRKHAGERNEPAYLRNTLHEIAALRNEAEENIARQTTENARTLFRI